MAQPTTSRYSQLRFEVGDGGGPEVFTALCGLTTKNFNITNNTATTVVPDCADEDLAAFEEVAIVSQAFPISGTGVFVVEDQKTIIEWALNGETKNVRVYPGATLASGDIEYFEGPMILSDMGVSVERGQKVQADMTFNFTTKPTVTLIA